MFASACALAFTSLAAAAPPEDGSRELPWRVGGRVGFTADAAAFPDSEGHVLEIYVRIPPATIANLVRAENGKGQVRLTARIRGAFGGSKRATTEDFELDPADTTRGFGKVVVLRFPARPGNQHIQVVVEDLLSRKRGLAYIGRRVTESASVEGDFDVEPAQAGRDLSSIEFVWSENVAGAEGAFQRAGQARLPNPERLYGLYAGEVRAFFQARGLAADARPWHWVARVLDAKSGVVAEQQALGAAERRLSATASFDLSRAPAGGYALEVKAWQEGDSGALLRRARFSVAWQPDYWLHDPERIADIVHLLLPAAMEDSFALMQPGEQEAFMDRFWRVRDPDPETARNEARESFMERVAIANQRYARHGLGSGILSDMGRVYARYGEPSEVHRQVLPAGDNTLLEALGELAMTEDHPIGEVHQKGPGGDMRPFEIWIYEGEVPLPPDAEPNPGRRPFGKRIVFLFVDQHGTGDYALRYTSE